MNRRKLPLILMLVAGAVTCIITLIRKYSVLHSLIALFGAFVIFFFLGSVMKWTLDYFDRENEEKRKEAEEAEEAEEVATQEEEKTAGEQEE